MLVATRWSHHAGKRQAGRAEREPIEPGWPDLDAARS